MSLIPQRLWVLVTGANGYLASHIVDQLLLAGFNVRGTVRTIPKGNWLVEYFVKKFGLGRFELAEVPDMAAAGAFQTAVKGVSAVVHTACDMSFGPDPNVVINNTLNGTLALLRASTTESLIKRFVLTSSAAACAWPSPDTPVDIDENSWHTAAVERAWAPAPYEPARAWDVYAASKTQQEQAVWAFARDNKPQFVVNSVIPNTLFGSLLAPGKQDNTSTNGFVTGIYQVGWDVVGMIPPQYHSDVHDIARLHVIAITDPDVANERLFGYADKYDYNQVLQILRRLSPDHKFPADKPGLKADQSRILRRGRAEDLLRRHYGQDGFVGLVESVEETVRHVL
ncbi:NAD(P)-binding protein [Aspergillus ellipticus CBS 707.79]|uniref:NAD(P)-binding protein n=1 Tax=Aspergillus ellipticus CBS 707.79 TaxID=1448320 RepID=A0A319D073_9EURO|nr:NAD(P)-binding protein [Aspergillus ellipticus CBS 707.79]